jgi:hypothetical protein
VISGDPEYWKNRRSEIQEKLFTIKNPIYQGDRDIITGFHTG